LRCCVHHSAPCERRVRLHLRCLRCDVRIHCTAARRICSSLRCLRCCVGGNPQRRPGGGTCGHMKAITIDDLARRYPASSIIWIGMGTRYRKPAAVHAIPDYVQTYSCGAEQPGRLGHAQWLDLQAFPNCACCSTVSAAAFGRLTPACRDGIRLKPDLNKIVRSRNGRLPALRRWSLSFI
jgi:hypothetical protein